MACNIGTRAINSNSFDITDTSLIYLTDSQFPLTIVAFSLVDNTFNISNLTAYVTITSGVLAYSYDGFQYKFTQMNNFRSIIWSGNYFIAHNSLDGYAYSYDGIKWKIRAQTPNMKTIAVLNLNSPNAYPFPYGNKITWNGKQFFAVGGNNGFNENAYNFATSYDGITWYDITNNVFQLDGGSDISTISNVEQISQNAQLILDKFGTEETQQLDIVSDKYYQQGINNFNISVQHNTLK